MPSQDAHTTALLRLQTFGALAVRRENGDPLPPAANQRRTLALLAVLASSPNGVSRDRLLLLLWPDQEPEKARHALTQSLYHARRSLECDDLFTSGSQIALNPARVGSDVGDLETALRERQWRNAAGIYAGVFLDEFHLPGSGEFERWISAQRRHWSDRITRVLEELAAEAEQAGDALARVAWRRRALEIDPLNGNAAGELVEALLAHGDTTGALREAVRHEALLRDELDVSPDARMQSLIQTLRARAAAPALPATLQPTDDGPATPIYKEETPSGGSTPRFSRDRAMRLGWLAVAASLVMLGVALARSHARAESRVLAASQRILVAPFRVAGADREFGFLREGLVELLSARLGDAGSPQAVDAGAALNAWRGQRNGETPQVARERTLRAARRFGATSVVIGSVVGNARKLNVSATLVDVSGRTRDRNVTVEGSSDSLSALVDELAVRLLILEADESDRFADRTTPSLFAMRSYLDGLAAYRRADHQLAAHYFERSLALDSTFALAAFQLALASDNLSTTEQHDRALAIAWAHRADLSDRDRAHLLAFAGPRYPEPSSEAEQLAAWETAVEQAPDRPESWMELSEQFLRSGRLLGVRDHDRRALRAAERALELAPADRRAFRIVAMLAARTRDTSRLRSLASAEARADSSADVLGGFVTWRVAHALRDEKRLSRVRGRFPALSDASLRAIALSSQYDAVAPADGERALRLRRARVRSGAERLDDLLGLHSLALLRGDATLALDVTEQIQELHPATRVHLRLRVLDGLYGAGDSAAMHASAHELIRHLAASATTETQRAVQLADACVVSQWRVRSGMLDSARGMAALMKRAEMPTMLVPVGANPRTCAAILEAAIAVRAGETGARAAVARLDSLMLGGPAAGDAATYAHLWIARLWEELGDSGRALQAIRRRPYLAGWPRYLAMARREEERLAAVSAEPASH